MLIQHEMGPLITQPASPVLVLVFLGVGSFFVIFGNTMQVIQK